MPERRAPKPAPQPPSKPAPAAIVSCDPALQARIVEAVTTYGESHSENEVTTWRYNGDTLSIKYVAPTNSQPLRLMVAAFRQGVVFQIEGEKQQVLKRGDWLDSLP